MAARARTAQPTNEVEQPARKAASKSTKKSSGPAAAEPPAEKRPAKKTAPRAPAAKASAAGKPAAKAAPARKTGVKTAERSRLSAADRHEFTALITAELERVRGEYRSSMAILDALKNAGQDSAGDDPADAGAKTFEREQEMSLANNRLDLIAQMERAMRRIDEGTYGVCESCGKQIPKARLQAFPQATLCVECKSREERR